MDRVRDVATSNVAGQLAILTMALAAIVRERQIGKYDVGPWSYEHAQIVKALEHANSAAQILAEIHEERFRDAVQELIRDGR